MDNNNSRRKTDINYNGTMQDVHLMVATLPGDIQAALHRLPLDQLLEVVMDLGRYPEARFTGQVVRLMDRPVTHEELAHVVALVGEFSDDNRAGIERTLHRISCMRNRKGNIIGLTLRVGRAVYGGIELLRDLIETGKNILILGRPGVGKTTKLREMGRVLADDLKKRVIIIDTSNEIAGDGDIPHPGIGAARRMQVPKTELQHSVMIEAVENHMPEVIVVDEIGTEAEAAAARTIAERGVQLIGTAHGNTLDNLINNPTLSDLVGGIQTVTLSDEEARRRGTTKTITERKAPPTFDIVVEMATRDELVVHQNTAEAVDSLLRGFAPRSQKRAKGADGGMEIKEVAEPKPVQAPAAPFVAPALPRTGAKRIYPHAVNRDLLERAMRDLGLDAKIVSRAEQADVVIGMRSKAEDLGLKRISRLTDAPVHLIKRNTTAEIRRLLQNIFNVVQGVDDDEIREAVEETENAIQQVIQEGVKVSLTPRRPPVRKLQHRLIARYHLEAESVGSEPRRHLVIYPAE